MLSVTVLAIGRLKERYWKDACAEYAKRLGLYCRFSIVELAEAQYPKDPSPAQVEKCLEEEGNRMKGKIPSGAFVAALCIEGDLITSQELAEKIQSLASGGISQVCFLIGGSYGLWEPLKRQAAVKLSMSRMTFPHQLARVMVCEQVYRAFSIAANGKYHK